MKEVIIMSYTTSTEITGKDNTPVRMPTYVPNMPAYLIEETHTTIARWAVEESWKLGLHPLQIAAHELFTRQHSAWIPYLRINDSGVCEIGSWEVYPCCKDHIPADVSDDSEDFNHWSSVQHVATQYHVKPSQLFDVYAILCEERKVTLY